MTNRRLFITADGNVYRSTNGGQTRNLALDCLKKCRTTAIHPSNGQLVFVGGEGGLWRSTSGGQSGSWQSIGTGDMSGTNGWPVHAFKWTGV